MTEIVRVVPNSERRKKCTTCGDWWPIGCFPADSKNPDGHRNECKGCRAERRLELANGAARCKPWRRKGLAKCAWKEIT